MGQKVTFRVWKSDVKGWGFCPYSVKLKRIYKVTSEVTQATVLGGLEHDAAVALRTAGYDLLAEGYKGGVAEATYNNGYALLKAEPKSIDAMIWACAKGNIEEIAHERRKDMDKVGLNYDEAVGKMEKFAWQGLRSHARAIKGFSHCVTEMKYATEFELVSEDGKLATRSDIVGAMRTEDDCTPFVEEVRKAGERERRELFYSERLEMAVVHMCATESAEAIAERLEIDDRGLKEGIRNLPTVSLVWAETQEQVPYIGHGHFGEVRAIEQQIRGLTPGSEVPKSLNRCKSCFLKKQCDTVSTGFTTADKL